MQIKDLDGKLLLEVPGNSLQGAYLWRANLREADLWGAKGIVSFGPVGNERRIGYAVLHKNNVVMVKLGCFWGTKEQAIEAICKKYYYNTTAREDYIDLVNVNCQILKSRS